MKLQAFKMAHDSCTPLVHCELSVAVSWLYGIDE